MSNTSIVPGSQKVQIIDADGDVVDSFGGAGGGGSTTVDGASSPNASQMIGGEYNTTPPTVINGQVNTLQLDSSGRLITNNAPLTGTADSIAINDGTNTLTVPTQASTTATQTGVLIQGATTTSAPSYTTAKTNPLSLDTAGNLRTASSLNDGTNTVGTVNSSGVAGTQNSLFVAGSGYTTTTISLSAGTQATSWFDMLNYAWVSVEILTNTTPATLTFQTSGDASQTAIRSMALLDSNQTSSPLWATTTTGATNVYHGPRSGRYFRVNSNLAGGNTATLVLTFFTNASASITPANVGSSSATGSAYPGTGFGMAGKALTTSPTAATTGNLTALTTDVMGEALVSSGGLVTTSVPANASNVVIKAAPGRLCRIIVTTTGVTPLAVYDNATTNSGTIIGQLPASPALGVYDFATPAAAGITIAGSATNPAVTLSWI